MNLRQMAIKYSELGYKVFPCNPETKIPATAHGCLDATDDYDQIDAWWTKWPTANIGLSTNGLIVIDVDYPDNPWQQYIDNDDCPLQLTPRGGYHYIFRQPAGAELKNTTAAIAPNVDTRANGGYIVVSPSATADGLYQWQPTRELPAFDDLPEAPAWLLDVLNKLSTTGANAKFSVANTIPSGQRNSALTRAAGHARRAGHDAVEIEALLSVMNEQRCQPPLPSNEISKIAESIAAKEPDQITVALIEDHWGQIDGEEKDDRPENPGSFPKHFLDVPGLIGDLIDYEVAAAYRPQPVLALAASISLQAVLCGRKIKDEYSTRPNLYCLGVGLSGSGKEYARQVNKSILIAIGAENLLGPEGIASHSGLITAVHKKPVCLMQIDEIGRILGAIVAAGNKTHYLHHISTNLMKMYTSSNTIYINDAYADHEKVYTINQPCCCVYGTTTPQSLYSGMTSDNIKDGMLGRMLIFEAEGRPPLRRGVARVEIPQKILTAARTWIDVKIGNLEDYNPNPTIIKADANAINVFNDLMDKADIVQDEIGEPYDALWSRITEQARKLALIYACSAHPLNPAIDVDAARWGCELAEYLLTRLIFLAANNICDSQYERERSSVLQYVASKGQEGLQPSVLRRYLTRKYPERKAGDILLSLTGAGDIDLIEKSSKGRTSKRYVAKEHVND
ncbi:MAG: DUF3987 domain-containing protein [FCB group bacterium]|nr:DUF3987 domain-containing protein [FCB group bacterium]